MNPNESQSADAPRKSGESHAAGASQSLEAPHRAYWRSEDIESSPADLQFLLDASKRLLGYRVHLAYKRFLDVIVDNYERWHAHGLIRNLCEPAPAPAVAFDFGAIDGEALTDAIGAYFYIYCCHKGTNARLMRPFSGRQVLYLRGYEFAVTLALGDGVAAEARSVETLHFNAHVDKLVGPDLCVFRVLSPEEAQQGMEMLASAFHAPDIDAIAQSAMRPFRSVFLNALDWQDGVRSLLDSMDHYLVYVSAVTPSALWELEQLDTDARRGRVTVVFDAGAIARKGGILAYQKRMLEQGEHFIWPRNTPPSNLTPDQLRATLATKVHVVSLEAFAAVPARSRARIAATSSARAPGQREMSLDFQFYPSLAASELAELRAYDAWLGARIERATAGQSIGSALLFLNDIQLRVYTTLLLGQHDDTGRALAAYSGLLCAVRAAYGRAPELTIWQSPGPRAENLARLDAHIEVARHWGASLMASGAADRFDDIHAQASADFLGCEGHVQAAVDAWLRAWPTQGP